jgi:hypothetical protein
MEDKERDLDAVRKSNWERNCPWFKLRWSGMGEDEDITRRIIPADAER